MQIQLHQKAIEVALQDYITKQGINLYGRDVTIEFTAGRKDRGLSADITIGEPEMIEIPGFTDAPDVKEDTAPPNTTKLKTVSNSPAPSNKTENPSVEEDEPAFTPDDSVEEETPKVTTSLFGS